MAIAKSDLDFLMTNIDYDQTQTDVNQSTGGYPTLNSLFPNSSTVSSDTSPAATSILIGDSSSFSSDSYALVNGELCDIGLSIQSESGDSISLQNRGTLNSKAKFLLANDKIFNIKKNEIFNNRMDKGLKQYRCFAVKNTNSTYSAHNISVYSPIQSSNPNCSVKFAIEIPKSTYKTGTATGRTKITLTDTTLSSSFEDNHFRNCVVRFTSSDTNNGASRVVLSYDKATKKLVLNSPLLVPIASGVGYKIEPTPAQRTLSVNNTPLSSGIQNVISDFSSDSVVLDFLGTRVGENTLLPHEIFYIWVERTLLINSPFFQDNSVGIAVRYSTT